jgi:hypothetical protein
MRILVAFSLALAAASARAVEAESDLSIGGEFVYLHNNVRGEVWRDHLALGAGLLLVSDWHSARAGAEASVDVIGDGVEGGLTIGWAPKQEGRGWLRFEPHASVHLERGRFKGGFDGTMLLRRVDASGRRTIDQLQLHLEGELEIDRRWQLRAGGLVSFYSPPLDYVTRGDVGLLVTMAGHPEQWAAGLELGRAAGRWLWFKAGLDGVAYAESVGGGALMPLVGARVGPFAGVTVSVSGAVALGVAAAGADAPRFIGGLQVSYE